MNVSGHRLSTIELESVLVRHPAVAEAAVVGEPHDIMGQAVACFVGGFAKPGQIRFTDALPKTRSGKIMSRLLREIVTSNAVTGDVTTLEDLSVVTACRLSTTKNRVTVTLFRFWHCSLAVGWLRMSCRAIFILFSVTFLAGAAEPPKLKLDDSVRPALCRGFSLCSPIANISRQRGYRYRAADARWLHSGPNATDIAIRQASVRAGANNRPRRWNRAIGTSLACAFLRRFPPGRCLHIQYEGKITPKTVPGFSKGATATIPICTRSSNPPTPAAPFPASTSPPSKLPGTSPSASRGS